ncbi:hypothetical protein [Haladaptatus cibarius]|uniref:hypothetical protein n=1 Tax=Haladaptatus cibarius TaxID=453847 RepID=UPI0006798FDA|nr:hypothetical protein [Haladaptatus cibarius]
MTNTDDDLPVRYQKSNLELAVDVLKATYIPLFFGLGCLALLGVLWYIDLPMRPIILVLLVLLTAGPFVVTYCVLFAWRYQRRIEVPVVLLDPEGKEWGLKYLHPNEFADAEIDGDDLATRRARATGETIYFAEGHTWEQRERLDRDSGEKETFAQRILKSTWEAEISTQEFKESVYALGEQRKRLVPLARAGVEARAGRAMRTLENTDRLSHALLLGAEEDNFLATGGANPFSWDLDTHADEEDLKDKTTGDDDDENEQKKRERAGSYDIQESNVPIEERIQNLERATADD